MVTPWAHWFVLASIAAQTLTLGPTACDDLPVEAWVESLSEVDQLELHYRGLTIDGEASSIDIYVGGSEHALLRAGGAKKRQQVWISDGVVTTLIETGSGPPVVGSVDMKRAMEDPLAWFQGARKTVLDADGDGGKLQVRVDLWPSTKDKGTFDVGISFGFGSSKVPFNWLARFRSEGLTGERVDDTFVIELEGGARIVVDASNGLVRELAAASRDGEKGVMRRTGLELDTQFEMGMFKPIIPDDAEKSKELESKLSSTQEFWSLYRGEFIRRVLAASRSGKFALAARSESLNEVFASFHLRSSVPWIENAVNQLRESTDQHIDKLLGYLRASPGDPAVRKRFDEEWKKFEDAVDEACQRAAATHAKAAVRAPFESENPLLEDVLEIEREAAIACVAAELRRELRAHVDSRRGEIPDDGTQVDLESDSARCTQNSAR